MSINQRVKAYFFRKEISQTEFCQMVGYSEKNLSNVISGRTKVPKVDLIEAFLIFDKKLSIRWLVLGEGDMYEEKIEKKPKSTKNELDATIEKLESVIEQEFLITQRQEKILSTLTKLVSNDDLLNGKEEMKNEILEELGGISSLMGERKKARLGK